ncbi:hypothetical protein [Oxalicibacterium solurbis]|uniref:Uncharacterized protein n=1 Tax=Oxalicibacterium solurbis TaxID=69280 RepID=A0A8J3F5K8_9BURK|nr:hypothetical protein [Oxalicibacterium solurbis]GGI55637.1 hypothetical protein GCM10011430_28110 [Oxalicibacterium solurbis]
MATIRSKRRDDEVDAIRTINWFRYLGDELGTYIPRHVQRYLEPGKSDHDIHGIRIRNNKYLEYSQGLHVPRESLITHANQLIPGSGWEINHVLWSVLRHKGSISGQEHGWFRHLVPEIQIVVFEANNEIRLKGGRHYLGSLERRASVDSLAALTILLRMNYERQDSEQVWECGKSIYRVLLMLGDEFNDRQIGARLFALYSERVFSLVKHAGLRMYVEECNYPVVSQALCELAEHLRYRASGPRDRKQESFYALQLLNGERSQFLRDFFQPLVGPDLDLGPPTETSLYNLKAMRDAISISENAMPPTTDTAESKMKNRTKKRRFHMRRIAEKSASGEKALEMKLALFDPKLHSGEVMDFEPIGREFGAKAGR